jgi:uncharacterized protein (DUF433 family)
MTIAIAADPVPLRQDERGVIRVGSTRVTLDTVIGAFKDGASAEEIVQQYDVLELGDVYKVIGYYLHHRTDVEDYLRQQGAAADELRSRLESQAEVAGIRDRLLARQQAKSGS